MAEKGSEERYDRGGRVLFLVYESDQRMRDGEIRERRRAKRFYLPGDSRDVTIAGPRPVRKRTGRSVIGVEVHYAHRLRGARARRGKTRYELPERWSHRTKVVEVPESARNVRLSEKRPPRGRVAVA